MPCECAHLIAEKQIQLERLMKSASLLQAAGLARIQSFLQWLSRFLLDNLYVGAARSRRHLAMSLFQLLLTVFGDWLTMPALAVSSAAEQPSDCCAAADASCADSARQLESANVHFTSRQPFQPFPARVLSKDTVQVRLFANATPPVMAFLITLAHGMACMMACDGQ
jgi:hypothetical protein